VNHRARPLQRLLNLCDSRPSPSPPAWVHPLPGRRGPQGIWTLQRAGAPLPSLATTFAAARPGLTHAALLGLMRAGKLVYICSQNVDSLHLRSGGVE
jgi:hypothetical protein